MAAGAVGTKAETRSITTRNWLSAIADRPLVLSLLLVIATLALYYPVHHHPFINYDDREYVYENPRVQSGLSPSTIKWALTTYAAGNWHPLTWLSHALDCQLFGLNPAGHHDVNVLFHALNAVLLFWVLRRATGYAGRSFMVAALFALHPINVESVAWVAERKNVLSMMFFLLALGAYRWYVSRPRLGRYSVVAGLFALGLMAKPQIITLPFVLLLWDYWPLERPAFRSSLFAFRRHESDGSSGEKPAAGGNSEKLLLLLEKLPLFLIAAASAAITLKAQSRGWFPRDYRVGNAILAYGRYVKKALWPSDLALLYPHPGVSLNWWQVAAAALVLLVITAFVVIARRHRYLPVGWFWFLGKLVPMLGIVQVGVQAMADRYAYVSFLGLFIMVCWGVADWAEARKLPAALLPTVSFAALLLLAIVARRQIGYWQSDQALWGHTLQVTTRNWVAETEMGTALAIGGKVEEAMPYFYRAAAINPDDTNSNMGIAIYNLRRKDYREAIRRFETVVRNKQAVRPSFLVQVYKGMAESYQALGNTAKAQECLRAANNIATP